MEKSDVLLKLGDEYALYDVESVKTIDDVKAYILVCLDDYKDYINICGREIINNTFRRIKGGFANNFAYLIGYENIDLYSMDNEILKEIIEICRRYSKLMQLISKKMDDNNFLEIYKLLSFIQSKFLCNYRNLDERRLCVEMIYNGIWASPRSVDSIDDIEMFFSVEINKISLSSRVEKCKKM